MGGHIKSGQYDLLVTSDLELALAGSIKQTLRASELPDGAVSYLIDVLSRRLSDVLESLEHEGENKLALQVALINDLLRQLQKTASTAEQIPVLIPEAKTEILRWVGVSSADRKEPLTGLLSPWLFTAGRGTPDLLNELRSEMTSCDRLDILVSFIKVSGLRKIRDILEAITAQDASGRRRTEIRVITTTYTGATDQQALDELARLPGCSVKVSLDSQRSRLHAKAWIFHRETGFGTAYVGSANMSHAALMGGLEWTVKFAQRGQPGMFSRATASFESLWEDDEFQLYCPDDPVHRRSLANALQAQRRFKGSDNVLNFGFLEVHPKPFQQQILDQLAFERSHGRKRNLLVAATGTGKTVMAALDYRRHARTVGGKPRLLFLAHRDVIVQQARNTFRQVLGDNQFGELLSGSDSPDSFDHVFAVINSVNSQSVIDRFGIGYWSMVIVDECHHIAADQFSKVVRTIRPEILLGLTATPERGDGQSIMGFFDSRPDGSPAAELRLWQALDLQLLCPFEYYGCDDETDFSSVAWGRSDERDQVRNLVEGNEIRAANMLREWRRLVSNPLDCRTLLFCVSIEHAEYIADFLRKAGLPAIAIHGRTDKHTRASAPKRLETGELCALVTVELYNEGVDLPFVDTLLLLRPTQSPVVFQQQIGRGLRLFEGKTSCLIMDFVGQHRQDFRFDRLLASISGLNRKQLKEGFEAGFPTLPSGCYMHLQKQTRQQVLGQLQRLLSQGWSLMIRELQMFVALNRNQVGLLNFLEDYNLALEDVFRDSINSGWLSLRSAAGLISPPLSDDESFFSRRLASVLHWDDPLRLDQMELLVREGVDAVSDAVVRKMFHFSLVGRTPHEHVPLQTLRRWISSDRSREELREVHSWLAARCTLSHRQVPGLAHTPLCLHASYTGTEIAVAMSWFTPKRQAPVTSGVLVFKEQKIEALFVTLDKSKGFHESIAYSDCAVSPSIFKWQTQNSARPETDVGRRYIESASNGWTFQLFVREKKGDAFRVLGPVKLRSWEGSGPMTIYWDLEIPMTVALFRSYSAIRGV